MVTHIVDGCLSVVFDVWSNVSGSLEILFIYTYVMLPIKIMNQYIKRQILEDLQERNTNPITSYE